MFPWRFLSCCFWRSLPHCAACRVSVLPLVVGRAARPAAASASAPVTPSSSVLLVTVAAVATTVAVAVAVSVLETVLLIQMTSLVVCGGGGRAGWLPVAGLSVVPAGLASGFLSPLFGRIRAAVCVLRIVRIGGGDTPHSLGTSLGSLAGWFEVLVEVQ